MKSGPNARSPEVEFWKHQIDSNHQEAFIALAIRVFSSPSLNQKGSTKNVLLNPLTDQQGAQGQQISQGGCTSDSQNQAKPQNLDAYCLSSKRRKLGQESSNTPKLEEPGILQSSEKVKSQAQ